MNRVHPPDVLTVLIRVLEDRRRIQHLDVPQISHKSEVFDVDAELSQPHPQLDLESVLESVGCMALQWTAALVQEPRHRCHQQQLEDGQQL
jgi:hypothetical protein